MKLTDLTMIYIVILLPIVITVMVNTSFVVTAQKHELYTKTVIDSSVRDAVDSMKKVENKDSEIDYGYSNDIIGKISVDPKIAVNTFFNSMALNLGAVNDDYTADYLRAYVPVIAVMDYDGLYTYSVDSTDGTNLTHTIKPKTYFTFSYCIIPIKYSDSNLNKITKKYKNKYDVIFFQDEHVEGNENTEFAMVLPYEDVIKDTDLQDKIYGNLVYNIKYTQDMYVYLDVFQITTDGMISIRKFKYDINVDLSKYNNGFYLDDDRNNTYLSGERFVLYTLDEAKDGMPNNSNGTFISDKMLERIRDKAKEIILDKKAEVITKTCQNHILAAVKNHNKICSNLGLNYEFKYEPDMNPSWYEKNKGVGLIVMVQGLKSGKSYINYTLSNISTVGISTKYYISETLNPTEDVVYKDELENEILRVDFQKIKEYTQNTMYYHVDEKCPLYRAYVSVNEDDEHAITLAPGFFYTEAEAVANGFRCCPVCKP